MDCAQTREYYGPDELDDMRPSFLVQVSWCYVTLTFEHMTSKRHYHLHMHVICDVNTMFIAN